MGPVHRAAGSAGETNWARQRSQRRRPIVEPAIYDRPAGRSGGAPHPDPRRWPADRADRKARRQPDPCDAALQDRPNASQQIALAETAMPPRRWRPGHRRRARAGRTTCTPERCTSAETPLRADTEAVPHDKPGPQLRINDGRQRAVDGASSRRSDRSTKRPTTQHDPAMCTSEKL